MSKTLQNKSFCYIIILKIGLFVVSETFRTKAIHDSKYRHEIFEKLNILYTQFFILNHELIWFKMILKPPILNIMVLQKHLFCNIYLYFFSSKNTKSGHEF